MIQATTPTHTFKLPFETAAIQSLRVTYAQDGVTVLTKKELGEFTLLEKSAQITLTQKETLLFDPEKPVQVQMRVLTMGGDALASKIKRVPCSAVLDKEVLV